MTVCVIYLGSVESAPKFEKKNTQKFDTDETSISAREELIEHNMLWLIDLSVYFKIARSPVNRSLG